MLIFNIKLFNNYFDKEKLNISFNISFNIRKFT